MPELKIEIHKGRTTHTIYTVSNVHYSNALKENLLFFIALEACACKALY